MALSIGIVGLPNVGKSTLFNALTKAQNAQAANYPFCTIEPNKATVPVPDRRIDALVDLVHPQKTINATVDFIDIAGLVRGASKGEGLGNQFLGNIRECAAILEVVRCFEDDDITHVDGSVDPLRDIETIETELLLADIQGTSKRHERMVKMSKGDKDARVAADEMARLLEHLNNGNPASTFEAKDCPAFAAAWHELGLLTAKKIIYCANVDEDSLAEDNAHVTRLREFAATRNIEVVKICARIEEELQGLSDEEQREMLGAYGIEESGLLRRQKKALLELAESRGNVLWALDKAESVRFSHENPDVAALYRDYLGSPMSPRAHHLLHTDHNGWKMPSEK